MTGVIGTIARTTLLEALRGRMLWLMGCVLVLAFGLAGFLQQVAIIETAPIQAAIIAALLRACAAFLTAAFVVMSMVREANDKVLELMLAQAWPRSVYLLGKFVGFSTAAVLLAVAFGLPLLPFAPAAAVAAWSLSLACELLIVAAMSLFFVLTLTHVVPALAAVLGFYVLARSIAAIQIIAAASEASVLWTDRLANWTVQGISFLLPRLDLMTQTAWLVDAAPTPAVLGSVLLQTAVYAALLVAGAQFDLHRQNL